MLPTRLLLVPQRKTTLRNRVRIRVRTTARVRTINHQSPPVVKDVGDIVLVREARNPVAAQSPNLRVNLRKRIVNGVVIVRGVPLQDLGAVPSVGDVHTVPEARAPLRKERTKRLLVVVNQKYDVPTALTQVDCDTIKNRKKRNPNKSKSNEEAQAEILRA